MKKIETILLSALFITVLALSISSCSKKNENASPVIVIDSPTEGAMTMLPDSTHIEGRASDDEELHEMSVIVKDHMGVTVFADYPTVHALPSYSFHYHFATSDTGMYHLHITAADHDGGLTSKEVMFHVMQ